MEEGEREQEGETRVIGFVTSGLYGRKQGRGVGVGMVDGRALGRLLEIERGRGGGRNSARAVKVVVQNGVDGRLLACAAHL